MESDEEDLGQLEDGNSGDSSTGSEYNNNDNLVPITINVFLPEIYRDAEQVEFIVQEERPKCKRNVGVEMSLGASLDKTN